MIDFIEQHANRTTGSVQAWHFAIRGAMSDAFADPSAISPRAYRNLDAALRNLRSHHQMVVAPIEGGHLRGAIDLITEQAEKDAGVKLNGEDSTRIAIFAHDLIDETLLVIRDLLRTDENIVKSRFRNAQIEASLNATRGVDPKVAIDLVRDKTMTALKLTHLDAIGRRWNSAVIARLEVRKALIDIYNHTFMWCLLHDGVEIAAINDKDGGTVFSITGATQGVPSYQDVSAKMHPNAQFLVSRA